MDYIDYNLVYRNNPSWMPMLDEKARTVSTEKAYEAKEEKKSTRPLEPVSSAAKAPKVVISEDQEKPQTKTTTRKRVVYLAADGVRYDVEGSKVRNEIRENATYGKDGKRAAF